MDAAVGAISVMLAFTWKYESGGSTEMEAGVSLIHAISTLPSENHQASSATLRHSNLVTLPSLLWKLIVSIKP